MIQPQTVDPPEFGHLRYTWKSFSLHYFVEEKAIAILLHMQSLSNAINDTVKLRLKCPNTFLGSFLMCSCCVVFLHHLVLFCFVISFSEISYGSETSLLISASGCLIYDLNHSDRKRKAHQAQWPTVVNVLFAALTFTSDELDATSNWLATIMK